MELIYLYVHHYRNIFRQEFPLCASFHVHYTDSRLDLCEHDFPLKKILFTANLISDIHLLVGKTGAGKSNLLSLIGMNFHDRQEDYETNHSRYFLVYHIENNTYYFEGVGFCLNREGTVSEYDGMYCARYTPADDSTAGKIDSCSTDLSTIVWIRHTPASTPARETLAQNENTAFLTRVHYALYQDSRYYTWKHIYTYLQSFSGFGSPHFHKYFTCTIHMHEPEPSAAPPAHSDSKQQFIRRFQQICRQIDHQLSTQNVTPISRQRFENLCNATESLFTQMPEEHFSENCLSWDLEHMQENEALISGLMEAVYEWRRSEMSLIARTFDIEYENLSSGELQLVSILANIDKIIQLGNATFSPAIFLLDEPETYMHPELCRTFLASLTALCRSFKTQLHYQFILTSHSPFLLSDLPSECVTLISIDSQTGACQPVPTHFPCFAGNIHQLLLDGFFLNSTVGELANQTLHTIISFFKNIHEKVIAGQLITDEELSQYHYYLSLIPSVGDPVIRNRLKEISAIIGL